MNKAERDALREKHSQVGDLHPECKYCWTVNYPCDVIKVLDYAEFLLGELKSISAVWDGE